MSDWLIAEGGLDDPRVIALVEHHATSARAATPSGDGHSYLVNRLRAGDIRFFHAQRGEAVLAIGALKQLGANEGEVKSMHTAESARGLGVGTALLDHIMATARAMEMGRLWLETHPGAYFAPAVSLYRKAGFVDCGPFGDYQADPASMFMCKEL